MSPVGILWGIQRSNIIAAAAVAGLELDTPDVEFGVTNQPPEYLEKFPFEDEQAFRLFEGAPIARYGSQYALAPASKLLGKDGRESALVDQWVHFAEHEIASFSYKIMALAGYLGPYSKERQARALKFLDAHLASSPTEFLIADTLSLADIVLAAVAQQAGRVTCGANERVLYRHVFAHYEKVTADPRLKAIFGDAEFMKEPMTYKTN